MSHVLQIQREKEEAERKQQEAEAEEARAQAEAARKTREANKKAMQKERKAFRTACKVNMNLVWGLLTLLLQRSTGDHAGILGVT